MRVFVGKRLPGPPWEPVGFEVEVFEGATAAPYEEVKRRARDADALVTLLSQRVDAELLDACPNLRIVANYAVGLDNVDLEAARARGVWVTHTPGVLTEATADLTWALLLGVARRVVEGDRLVRSGASWEWAPDLLLGLELTGATLGVLGNGRIGRAVARRGEAFGMKVLARGRGRGASLDQLLRESDVLSLHAPLTDETRHVLDERALRQMKPTAIVINTSRGALIDEAALVRALDAGWIAGAGLDVYEAEPHVHPGLLQRDDVLLLPHIGSATVHTRRRMASMVRESVVAALEGRTPPHAAAVGGEPKRRGDEVKR